MTNTRRSKSLATVTFAALLGAAAFFSSSTAFAISNPKLQPIDPASVAASGTVGASSPDGVVYSSTGEPVMTNAWCDPITHACDTRPWEDHHNHDRHEK